MNFYWTRQSWKNKTVIVSFFIRSNISKGYYLNLLIDQFIKNHFYRESMISIESHSKQIKLLNEYIVALEKQIAAARKEAEEQQKGANNQVEDMRLMNEDINKLRN